MPTTGPAPEWDWYDNTDLKVGEGHSSVYWFLLHEELEEYIAELKERERRRIKPGFALPPAKKRRRR